VKEVERRIRVTDGVIKFMTVRVDEELKKAERRKARRAADEEKRKGRPARPAASEAEGVTQ
jgi:small subunit ribosomal protein S6